jgi:hypothetical protein
MLFKDIKDIKHSVDSLREQLVSLEYQIRGAAVDINLIGEMRDAMMTFIAIYGPKEKKSHKSRRKVAKKASSNHVSD